MSRDAASFPLVLFIPAAILAHLTGGGSALQLAILQQERADIQRMMRAVRAGIRDADTVIEAEIEGPTPQDAKPDGALLVRPEQAPDAFTIAPQALAKEREKERRDEEKKPQPVAQKEKEKDKEKEPEKEPAPVVPAPPPPPPKPDRRIAIRQHVEKNQPDNPNAPRISVDANRVDEETMARIRVHDRDDPVPMAQTKSGPEKNQGADAKEKPGHAEEKHGDKERAPGEAGVEHEHHAPGAEQGKDRSKPGEQGSPGAPAPGLGVAQKPASEGGAGPGSPEILHAPGAKDRTFDPANPGGNGASKSPGDKAAGAPPGLAGPELPLGLGKPGLAGGPRLSASMSDVVKAVGEKQLALERAGVGAALRAEHAAGGPKNNWKKYQAAIENYDPSVKLGNATKLNAAQSAFATYLNTIHNKIHPKFAEEFLASLDNLPKNHALNQNHVTIVEIVLTKDTGKIVKMGVTRRSSSTIFDAVALSSIERASPFGKAPGGIESADGNVYLHWEFHRDPVDACSSRNAWPYKLDEKKMAKKPAAPDPPPAPAKKIPLDDRLPARRPDP